MQEGSKFNDSQVLQSDNSLVLQVKKAQIQDLEAKLAELCIKCKYKARLSIEDVTPAERPKSTLFHALKGLFSAKKKTR